MLEWELAQYTSYYENNYPGQEVTIELVLQDYSVESIEALATKWNYTTVDEMLLGKKMVGYVEYKAYQTEYETNYKKNITITRPNGTTQTVSTLNISSTGYVVLENGIYTFTATMEGQEVSKSIDITDIQQYKEMVLGKEDENTYQINCIEDLIKFSENVNHGQEYEGKTIKLMRSLDFNTDSSYENATDTTTLGDYNEDGVVEGIKTEVTKAAQRGFVPIGGEGFWIPETYQTLQYYFKGTFEGNNYTISNLYINNSSIYNLGLFAKNYGTIQNLKLNGNISSTATTYGTYYIGGFVGDNYGTIDNCENSVEFNLNNRYLSIGGIVGNNDEQSKVTKSTNYSNINFEQNTNFKLLHVGGVVGSNNCAEITRCENLGSITIPEESSVEFIRVGGILGNNNNYNSLIKENINKGDISISCQISDGGNTGGVCGDLNRSGKVISCVNTGNITVNGSGMATVGGVVGYSVPGLVANSYNRGNINLNKSGGQDGCNVGGVIGGLSTGQTRGLLNAGKITITGYGNVCVGGVIGYSYYGENYEVYNIENIEIEESLTIDDFGAVIGNAYWNSGCQPTGGFSQGIAEKGIGNKNDVLTSGMELTAEILLEKMNAVTTNQENIDRCETSLSGWRIDASISDKYPILDWQ